MIEERSGILIEKKGGRKVVETAREGQRERAGRDRGWRERVGL